MAAPNEKIATSLEILRALQVRGRRVFSAKELSRVHRERLVKHGYLQRVIDGWLVSAGPEAPRQKGSPGDAAVCTSISWLTTATVAWARSEMSWTTPARSASCMARPERCR